MFFGRADAIGALWVRDNCERGKQIYWGELATGPTLVNLLYFLLRSQDMRRKVYGQSQVNTCPFCGEHAYDKNCQGVPVCRTHKDALIPDVKCACGGFLDIREGKFGTFFTCMECGTVSMSRMLEINGPLRPRPPEPQETRGSSAGGKMVLDRIREKIRRGEPLSLDELEFI